MKLTFPVLSVFGLIFFIGCVDVQDPNYSRPYGGYNDPYYGGSRHSSYDRDYYRDKERQREERELERERRRLEDERRRYEQERREEEARERNSSSSHSSPSRESCPPGYSPSERKCSPDERKHGCKDIRLSSGLGCVRR